MTGAAITTDLLVVDVAEHALVAGGPVRRAVAEHPRHDELPDLLT